MKAIVSLSGGLDSATVLASLLHSSMEETPSTQEAANLISRWHMFRQGEANDVHSVDVLAVSFWYGSTHGLYESEAASLLAEFYRVEHLVIDVRPIFEHMQSGLLTNERSGDIPEGTLAEDNMKQTVVPCRNLIFASILAGIAKSYECPWVFLGMHAGDRETYPDCRPDFLHSLQKTCYFATSTHIQDTSGQVRVAAPLLDLTKEQIVRLAYVLNVPFLLTRTCYRNQPVACGLCPSCQERLAAFKQNKMKDPLPYTQY